MRQFQMNGMPRPGGPVYNQEGNLVSAQEIAQEHMEKLAELLEAKRPEFEETLALRCQKDDEVFKKMGFQEQVGAICYQVGMGVYTLIVSPDGIHAQQVGQLGQ